MVASDTYPIGGDEVELVVDIKYVLGYEIIISYSYIELTPPGKGAIVSRDRTKSVL